MPLVSMRQLLDEAATGGYGVGAFNVNNMEQIQGIMEAARDTASPVIVQASRGARAYAGDRFLYHLMIAGSLLEDGKTVAGYDHNVAVTREVVDYAHARGVTVEGELGTLGGIEDGVGSGEVHLTDPDQAVEFVQRTGIDALAVAIGTSHGAYKFPRRPDGQILAMRLIEEIHRRLPTTHLVMHGSSSVPARLIERINAAGGRLRPAFGVPVEEIQLGIRHGVRKVNVDTDGRLAITAAAREALAADPSDFDPRRFTRAGRDGMRDVVAERMRQFGQAGHAGDYAPRSLHAMRRAYDRQAAAGAAA